MQHSKVFPRLCSTWRTSSSPSHFLFFLFHTTVRMITNICLTIMSQQSLVSSFDIFCSLFWKIVFLVMMISPLDSEHGTTWPPDFDCLVLFVVGETCTCLMRCRRVCGGGMSIWRRVFEDGKEEIPRKGRLWMGATISRNGSCSFRFYFFIWYALVQLRCLWSFKLSLFWNLWRSGRKRNVHVSDSMMLYVSLRFRMDDYRNGSSDSHSLSLPSL